PGLLKPIRLISASSATARNNLGGSFPGCGCQVTPPNSTKPKPRAAHAGTAAAYLSIPAARPRGLGKERPKAATGKLGAEKKEPRISRQNSRWLIHSSVARVRL